MSAYSIRVSEILALLDEATREIAVGCLFAAQTGPDGTTIWATATSGGGAIAVHLLACMLAQAWSASEAISIWVELVEGRKLEVAEAFGRYSISDYPTLAAMRSEITRAQLADWDASARAWVRVADNVKKPEISSLRLLLNDLKLDVTKGQQLYKNVVEVWRSAMMIMESFLLGQPQMVFDATALLGITAWHIFPDILILGATVRQLKHGDPLVQAGGVLAIGSERMPGKEDDMGGAICSLSLAHLRFYGPPHSRVQLSRHEYFQGHIREVHGSGIRKFEYMSAGFGAGNCVLLCSNLGIYYLYNLHRILTSPKSTSIFGPEQSLL